MQLPTQSRVIVRHEDDIRVAETAREQVRSAVLSFLDAAATSTGRETFYNTQEEQRAAEKAIHQAVFDLNRGLYGVLLTLPGVNDHNTQVGIQALLDTPHPGEGGALLDLEQDEPLLVSLHRERLRQEPVGSLARLMRKAISSSRH